MGRIGSTQSSAQSSTPDLTLIQDEQKAIVREVGKEVGKAVVRDFSPETDWRSRKGQPKTGSYHPNPQKPKRKRGKEGRKSRRRNRLEWRDRDREWETQQSHWKKYPQEQQKRILVESVRLWW
jgi:hypothetical protein